MSESIKWGLFMAVKKKTRSNSRKKNGNKDSLHLVIGILSIAFSVYLSILISQGAGLHTSHLSSELGFIGAFLYNKIRMLVGQCEYFIPFLLFIYGLHLTFLKLHISKRHLTSLAVILVCLLAFRHLSIDSSVGIAKGLEGFGGGLIGAIISVLLVRSVSKIGAIISLLAIIAIFSYLGTEGKIFNSASSYAKKLLPAFEILGEKIKNLFLKEERDTKHKSTSQKEKKGLKVKSSEKESTVKENDFETQYRKKAHKASPKINNDTSFIKELKCFNEEIIEEDKENKVIDYIESEEPFKKATSISLKQSSYSLPSSSLLDEVKMNAQINKTEIEENAHILKETLNDFGVKGEINNVNVGPTITQYEFKPASGVRVTKIVNLADDLALSLAVSGLRIEAPIPNKSAVGIEVPNPKPRTVKFKEVIASEQFINAESNITFALGKDISGHTMIGDLAKMPHLLIAGATGAGKSVCLNALITSILYKAKPHEVKFIMIDPKKVELNNYIDIPHLLSPVVTDTKKAAATLKWIVKEMERRYDVFSESGARDIKTYNQKFIQAEALSEEHQFEFMPQIVVIIDELADLMMVAPADVEDSICRLAQLARAAGIHLVIATQRPSVDIITGLIKANIPSRIAFAVSSQTDSRTILDMGGAEKLLGNGDMLYYPRGYAKPVRIQGVFVTDDEIDRIVNHVKHQAEPVYDDNISKNVDAIMSSSADSDEKTNNEAFDDLLSDACEFFIENGNASISMLQRHFRIGYTRAARIIDELEGLGFVGPYEGSKARKVKVSLADCREFFGDRGVE